MNSLFNYELDEQKIRLTLHDAELDYSDSAWFEFDNEFPAEASKPSPLAQFNFPKINLNINSNVLIPIFFILALGGVSAIMFKFIDFKTNKLQETERALESSSASLNVMQKIVPASIKEEPKQMAAAPVEVKKDTLIPTPIQSVVVSAPVNNQVANSTYIPQKTETIKPQYDASRFQNPEPVITQKTEPAVADTNSNSGQKNDVTVDNTKPAPAHQIIYKNRRKKLVIDQVETIKAPSLMSAQTPAAEEDELKIKQENN